MQLKTCKICDQQLPINNFSKHKSSKDGYNYYCKKCYSDKYSLNRNNYEEYMNKKLQKYFNSIDHKVAQRKAWDQVIINIRNGKLDKPNMCILCKNEIKELQAHHEDYNNPIQVIWLCPQCHGELHSFKNKYMKLGFNVTLSAIDFKGDNND